MAWTAPRTWVTGENPSAATMNAHIRDNFLETSAATVTTAGDLPYADAANSMGSRLALGAAGYRLVSTGSAPVWRNQGYDSGTTTTGDSAVFVPFDSPEIEVGNLEEVAVTLTTGTSAIVYFGARFVYHNTIGNNVQLSYQILRAGALDVAASTAWGTYNESDPASNITSAFRVHYRTGLTAGSNTFELVWSASDTADEATISTPWIMVKAL
jgi:hypothetical protein